jgi:DNA topoisomerase-2
LKKKLSNQESTSTTEFIPYYEGFKGVVKKIAGQKFLIKGCYETIGEDKIRITELPVGTWTMPYTTFLETLMDGNQTDKAGKKIPPQIRDFNSVCTEVSVDFTVQLPKGILQSLEATIDVNGCNGLEKLLKLFTTVSTTNMHMFDADCKLHKYETVEEIIDQFYGVRIAVYGKRKASLIAEMEKQLVKLSNRARYIMLTLDGTIDLRRKTAVHVQDLLTSLKFSHCDGDEHYKYLVKMPMDSVTEEHVQAIIKETMDASLAKLKRKTAEQMWLEELDILDNEYTKYKAKRETIQSGGVGVAKKAVKTVKVLKIKAK